MNETLLSERFEASNPGFSQRTFIIEKDPLNVDPNQFVSLRNAQNLYNAAAAAAEKLEAHRIALKHSKRKMDSLREQRDYFQKKYASTVKELKKERLFHKQTILQREVVINDLKYQLQQGSAWIRVLVSSDLLTLTFFSAKEKEEADRELNKTFQVDDEKNEKLPEVVVEEKVCKDAMLQVSFGDGNFRHVTLLEEELKSLRDKYEAVKEENETLRRDKRKLEEQELVRCHSIAMGPAELDVKPPPKKKAKKDPKVNKKKQLFNPLEFMD